jgi:hypothetical protein
LLEYWINGDSVRSSNSFLLKIDPTSLPM